MTEDKMSIIVTIAGDPKPRSVQFGDLYPLRGSLTSVVLLWTTNSYMIRLTDNIFMINGGRKFAIEKLGACEIVYRRRTSKTVSLTGANAGETTKISWVLGLQEIDGDKRLIALIVDETGKHWEWTTTL